MGKIDVAGDGEDGLLVGVDDHVDDVGQTRGAGGIEHVVMDGVAVDDAGAGAGAGDELAVVVIDNGLAGGDAGQNALAAAGEAGEEMGLDEALGHQQVGLGRQAVDDQVAAGGELAQVGQILGIVAVVDDDLLVGDDLGAELVDQLFLGGLPVAAGGDQDGDIRVGAALTDLSEHLGNDAFAGHGAGVVAGDEDDLLLALGHDAQLRGADGVGHGVVDQLNGGLGGDVVVHLRHEGAGIALFGNVQRQEFFSVGEFYDRHW